MRHMIKFAVVILPIIAVGFKWGSKQGWLILVLLAVFILTNCLGNEQRKTEETDGNRRGL